MGRPHFGIDQYGFQTVSPPGRLESKVYEGIIRYSK